MLRRAYAGEPDPQPHGRTCVSTAALRKPAVPRRLNARPQRGDRRGANPATTGCPSLPVTQARRRHAMVVDSFFEFPVGPPKGGPGTPPSFNPGLEGGVGGGAPGRSRAHAKAGAVALPAQGT